MSDICHVPDLRWREWRFAAVVAVVGFAFTCWASFAMPGLFGLHRWLYGSDAWTAVNSSQWVTTGAVGTVYQANPWLLALPGYEVLLTPAVWIGLHWNLVPGYPDFINHPSMWRVVGPYMFATSAFCTVAVDYLADTLSLPRFRRRALIVAVESLLVVPTSGLLVGHPEDLVGLAFASLSLALVLRRRPGAAAATLTVAILMQTWAGLLLPVLFVAAPKGRRLATAFRAAIVPTLVGVMLLALDFHHAYQSLIVQPQTGLGQHLPWWGMASHVRIFNGATYVDAVRASSTRSLAVVVALVGAWRIRHDPSPRSVLFLAALILYCRGLFEVEIYPYYLAPAALLMVLLASDRAVSTKRWATASIGAFLLYGSASMAYVDVSYSAFVALFVIVATAAVGLAAGTGWQPRSTLRDGAPGMDDRERRPGADALATVV